MLNRVACMAPCRLPPCSRQFWNAHGQSSKHESERNHGGSSWPVNKEGNLKVEGASLVCGTCGKWLWLLRSRPDQVGHATMRRGPPTCILTAKKADRLSISRRCWINIPYGSDKTRPLMAAHYTRLEVQVSAPSPPCQIPSSPQILSTFAFTSSVMRIVVPHSRLVSPGHLLVASMPILLPSPLTGDAKSR